MTFAQTIGRFSGLDQHLEDMGRHDMLDQLSLGSGYYIRNLEVDRGMSLPTSLRSEITTSAFQEQDLPKSLINVVIHTDIRCICAQFAVILRDPIAYQDFLKAQNEHAQKLLDVLQDVLFQHKLPNP